MSDIFSDRIALVVGVTAYNGRRLRNATADARSMAERLKYHAGFTLINGEPLINPTRTQLAVAIQDFASGCRASRAPLALFYFAGHGVFSRGRHWMLTKDWNGDDKLVDAYGYSTEDLVDRLVAERVILLLDTCRVVDRNEMRGDYNGGYGWGEAIARGVTATPWSKVLVAHACAQGAYAADGGAAGHGRYTQSLKEHLFEADPPLSVHEAISKANDAVAELTKEQQVPRMEVTSVKKFSFCLVKGKVVPSPPPPVSAQPKPVVNGMPLEENCCACPDVLASDWLFTLSCVFFATSSLGLFVTGLFPLDCNYSYNSGTSNTNSTSSYSGPTCKYLPEVSGPFISIGAVMFVLFCLHAWYFARKRRQRLMAQRARRQPV